MFFSPGFMPPVPAGTATVLTVHDLIHLHAGVVRRQFYELIIKPALRRARTIFTVSEATKKHICSWADVAPDRVAVVRNGVSATFVPHGPAQQLGKPYILYVGNRRTHKNIPGLLHGFALSDFAKEGVLVMTGDPDAEILALADSLGVSTSLQFCGRPSDGELAAYYRGAELLVLPSFMEGFGLPAAEAMACGTSVVASGIPALREILADAAIYADPHSPDDIAAAIQSVIRSPSMRGELRARGIARAQLFTWHRTAAAVWGTVGAIMLEQPN